MTTTALDITKVTKLPDLVEALAPQRQRSIVVEGTKKPGPPDAIVLTEAQKDAIAKVASIVEAPTLPTARVLLTTEQISTLAAERVALDEAASAIEARKGAYRRAVFNHFDVEAENAGLPDDVEVDKDGHYILKGEAKAPSAGRRFNRETREGSPTMTESRLKDLVEDPEVEFTHADYLACTTAVRVLDEAKVLLFVRSHPDKVSALAKAIAPAGNPTAALTMRKL